MINEQQSQDNAGIRNVSTKVPVWVADLLNIICKARGTDLYGLLQMVIQFIVETAKVDGPCPPQMKALLHMLKMDVDWNKGFRFSNPTATMDVAQCILILQQKDGKTSRQGFGIVMIDKPFLPGSEPKMTTCVDDIFERVTEVSMKGLYKELRQVGVAYETESLRETLMQLCDAYKVTLMDEELEEELPDLGNYHDFGRVIEWGNRTKQRKHRTERRIVALFASAASVAAVALLFLHPFGTSGLNIPDYESISQCASVDELIQNMTAEDLGVYSMMSNYYGN